MHTQINLPNFFILGAAKCGTTSLHHYLNQHPEIYLSPEKETCFFCKEFQVIQNPIDYFQLFDGVEDESVVGESSHVYMTSPDTPSVLHKLFPQARFLVILRHPADRAYSLYNHMRRNGLEPARTFEKALAIEDERFHSERFRENCPQYFYNFMYFRSGLYGEQLQRYLTRYSKDQCHVITLQELMAEPQGTLANIFRFLEVDPTFQPDLTIQNEGMVVRSGFIQQTLFNQTLIRKANSWGWPRSLALGPLKNLFFRETPPIDPNTRSKLTYRYANDLKLLYELLDRDLRF